MAIKEITEHQIQASFRKFDMLQRLSMKANVVVLLELLIALRLADADVAKRDRLTTAITYVLNYSTLEQKVTLGTVDRGLLENKNEGEQSIACQIIDVINDLPLKWGPGTPYESYASLSGSRLMELFHDLLDRPDLKFTLGAHFVIARKYLDICAGLIQLSRLKRMQVLLSGAGSAEEGDRSWRNFLFRRAKLGNLLTDYCMIREELAYIQLPVILLPRVAENCYLLSEELVIGSLMVGYVHLKEQIDT